jgi:RES domain-containing protein
VLVTVEGVLTNIVDLTDETVRKKFGVDFQTLTGDWTYAQAGGDLPPTQTLGRAAFDQGQIVGLKHPSSKNRAGFGVVVFATRVAGTQSWLGIHDPDGALSQRLS